MSAAVTSGPVTIYALADPRDGAIRYIGKTTDPQRRYRHHRRHAKSVGQRCKVWLSGLLAAGLAPQMIPLAVVPAEQTRDAERAAILGHAHCDLLNAVLPGGRRRLDC